MVAALRSIVTVWFFFAEQGAADQSALHRLPPTIRARVLLALLSLVILGLGVMLLICIGGRWTRKFAKGPPRHEVANDDDWWKKNISRAGEEHSDAQ